MKLGRQLKPLNNECGSVLMVIIGIMGAVSAISLAYLLNDTLQYRKNSVRSIHNSKATYVAEGMINILTQMTQDYSNTQGLTTTEDLKNHLSSETNNLAELTPEGYQVEVFDVHVDNNNTTGPIPSGPFEGLEARKRDISLRIKVRHVGSNAFANVVQESTFGEVSYLQFYRFGFGRGIKDGGGDSVTVDARIHSNGVVCLTGTPLRVRRLTAAGPVAEIRDPLCNGPTYVKDPDKELQVATDSSFSNFLTVGLNNGHGCTDCAGSGKDWAEYALWAWNENLMDQAHGIPQLLLPLHKTPTLQKIYWDKYGSGEQYEERLLVDPVWPGEGQETRSLKFAHKADIRIIGGVWFLKDPNNPNSWPGIAIWSDHPGRYNTDFDGLVPGGLNVGQKDIKDSIGTLSPANSWGGKSPRLFSHYETANSGLLDPDGKGVISYGNLFKTPTNEWKPGYYKTASKIDDALKGAPQQLAKNLLEGTRGGYRYGLYQETYDINDEAASRDRSRILTTNFDYKAFVEALDTCDPSGSRGELGCYFGSDNFMGREFNGIIFISNVWPGTYRGGAHGLGQKAEEAPFQQKNYNFSGPSVDNQAAPVYAGGDTPQQRALPYPLCASDKAGNKFVKDGSFEIPNCDHYGPSGVRAYPFDIRLFNTRDMSRFSGKGLSFISNNVVHVTGDLNETPGYNGLNDPTWAPILIGADQLIFLSNNWQDEQARWDEKTGNLVRDASDTQYNGAFISEKDFLYNEDWSGDTLTTHSTFLGSHRGTYYARSTMKWGKTPTGDDTFRHPTLAITYDDNFTYIDRQPPGMPYLTVFAIKSFFKR